MSRPLYNACGCLALALLVGCAGASPTERSFGDSVRATTAAQRLAPGAETEDGLAGDGQRTENVISVYRSEVGDPARLRESTGAEQTRGLQ